LRPAVWIDRPPRAVAALALTLLFSALLPACAPGLFQFPPPLPAELPSQPSSSDAKLDFERLPFTVVPGWETSDLVGMMPTFLRSCNRIARRPADAPFGNHPLFGTVAEWVGLCEDARVAAGRNANALRYFFETRFEPHLVSGEGNSEGLFTGYFEAELRGSWQPNSRYSVPIYARPNDLISVDLGKFRAEWGGESIAGRLVGDKFEPYPSRAAS
jgi:membrane-bound lytic murein transglycosylase A